MNITPKQYMEDWKRRDYAPPPLSIKRQMQWDIVAVWAGCLAGCLLVWWAVIRMAI
jgi:hypothetical protein